MSDLEMVTRCDGCRQVGPCRPHQLPTECRWYCRSCTEMNSGRQRLRLWHVVVGFAAGTIGAGFVYPDVLFTVGFWGVCGLLAYFLYSAVKR